MARELASLPKGSWTSHFLPRRIRLGFGSGFVTLHPMIAALAAGILLGFSAGLAPGPMLALVLAQSIRHGPREGCKVALTPLVTDAPIIMVALGLAAKLAELRPLLGLVSIAGALFVLYLAWESFAPVRFQTREPEERPRSFIKGIVTNLLNPHPWVFWLTVGAAILAKSVAQSWGHAAVFLAGFYLLLVGSKLAVALLAGRSRDLLSGPGYRVALRGLGVVLALFALPLFREGLKLLDVWP
jgi:threonine/homoserine/homoserine lactone efflux protein